jgi:hypothetical protein
MDYHFMRDLSQCEACDRQSSGDLHAHPSLSLSIGDDAKLALDGAKSKETR